MFCLTSKPLIDTQLEEAFEESRAGAFVAFKGIVRNHNDGWQVERLEYEGYADLCEKEAALILQEAQTLYSPLKIRTYHRTGTLNIGDTAVWIGVLSAHRDEAFEAARFLIDQYKMRLPIWKKEYYKNEDAVWVNAQTSSRVFSANHYYEKQIQLPEVQAKGQTQLHAARVLVVGAGGLGTSALESLAGSGIGTIGIVENDRVEESNLPRQNMYRHQDIGKAKAPLAARFIKNLNPSISVHPHNIYFNQTNATEILGRYDLILDCTDNFKTKYLLNDLCVREGKTLISASIFQWEGQLFKYKPQTTGCLRCLWPKIPPQNCVGTCAQSGVLGPVASILGHLQALEAIKEILQINASNSEFILYNLKNNQHTKIHLQPNQTCPVCQPNAAMPENDSELNQPRITISIQDIKPEELDTYEYIDIREKHECFLEPADRSVIHIPLSQWPDPSFEMDQDKKYIVFCAKGIRSLDLVEHLQREGLSNFLSLNEGIRGLNQRIYEQKN